MKTFQVKHYSDMSYIINASTTFYMQLPFNPTYQETKP